MTAFWIFMGFIVVSAFIIYAVVQKEKCPTSHTGLHRWSPWTRVGDRSYRTCEFCDEDQVIDHVEDDNTV